MALAFPSFWLLPIFTAPTSRFQALPPSSAVFAKASSLRSLSPARNSGRCGSARLWRGGLRKTASRPVWFTVIVAGSYLAGTLRGAGWFTGQARWRCPRGFLRQPLRGGPLLPHRSVARRSPWTSMAPFSLLALRQNWHRHRDPDWSGSGLNSVRGEVMVPMMSAPTSSSRPRRIPLPRLAR